MITKKEIEKHFELKTTEVELKGILSNVIQTPEGLLNFLYQYAKWNSFFGSAVAYLSGKIGASDGFFMDPDESIPEFADRSVFLASFVFDAAVEEFGCDPRYKKATHECLAQAFLRGCLNYFLEKGLINQDFKFVHPDWLTTLSLRVTDGYQGGSAGTTYYHMTKGYGYHLGSELFADTEFSVIDQILNQHFPELVSYLNQNIFVVGDHEYPGYLWISVHSGHGAGVEAEHFNEALLGVSYLYKYSDRPTHDVHRDLFRGLKRFSEDHKEFFSEILQRSIVDIANHTCKAEVTDG